MKFSKTEQNRLRTTYGDWAIVTGASSGIGKELATRLAEAGFSMIITGRRKVLLEEIAQQLTNTYHTQVIPIDGDLSKKSEVESLIENLTSYPIGLAIINAGYGTSGKFVDANLGAEINMLDLNCKALLMLTHHFSQKFAHDQKGGIILMSSMVGFQGVPNAAHYAATKAYVQSLGEAIALELKPAGVDVLCAAPGPVMSGFSERADMKMGNALSPHDVGIPMLKALGRKSTVLPGTLTKVLVYALRTVPRWAKIRIMNMVMGGFTQHQAVQKGKKSPAF